MSDKLAEKLKLPKTIFDYPYENSILVKGHPYDPSLVMWEVCPGNVTSRFNPDGDFEWVPLNIAVGGLINCDRGPFNISNDSEQRLIYLLRPKERDILSIWHRNENLLLLKVTNIRSLEKFANAGCRESDVWGYCKECKLVDQKSSHKNHDFKSLRVDTQSFPLMVKVLEPLSHGQKKNFPIWLQELRPEVTFFDRYLQKLNVYEGAIGVLVTLKLSGESSHIHEFYGFHCAGKPAAVGYKFYTEGFKISVSLDRLREKIREFVAIFKNTPIYRNLYVKFIIYKLSYELLKERISPLDAELISKLLITKSTFNLVKDLEKITEEIYFSKMHPVAKEKIDRFMKSENYKRIQNLVEGLLGSVDESSFIEYLVYTFIHSLSHAFLIASYSCSGVSENELDEQIKISGDVADIFIYERPLNGATRIIERNIMHKPGKGRTIDFLYYFENVALSCPIGEAEEFLYDLLFKRPQSQIDQIMKLVTSLETRKISLNEFMTNFSMVLQCCIPANTVLIEKLRKLSQTTLVKGKNVSEFNLHFEIYLIYLYLKHKLGRDPFPEEFAWTIENIDKIDIDDLSSILSQEEINKELLNAKISFNELKQLKSLIKDSKLFLEEVQKRYLRSCVDGCPSCLSVLCGEEILGISRYSISRNLIQRIIISAIEKESFKITPISENLSDKVCDRLKTHDYVFLLSTYHQRESLGALIGKIIQHGVSIRGFRVVKTNDNLYQYLTLMVT